MNRHQATGIAAAAAMSLGAVLGIGLYAGFDSPMMLMATHFGILAVGVGFIAMDISESRARERGGS